MNSTQPTVQSWSNPFYALFQHDYKLSVALAYLAALTLAELLTTLTAPTAGMALHAGLLCLLLLHTAARWNRPDQPLLLSLAFAPLIRIVSLSLPLVGFPLVYWFFFTSVPLFAAIYQAMGMLGYSWRDVGMNGRHLPWQLLVGLTGLGLGYAEYQILQPEPLVNAFTWQQLLLPALILLVSTGLLEELIFRRLMQQAAIRQLGRWRGIAYVALLFAVLHIGYQSLVDVVFVFVVGLFFGWVVTLTKSLVGVTLAHGLTNIVLFLVMPFWAGNLSSTLASPVTSPPAIDFLIENAVWLLLLLASFGFMGILLMRPPPQREL